jgi:geranylgeranyl pyrophosphate synthase
MSAAGLAAFVEQARADIERALDTCLSEPSDRPAVVTDAMRYSLLGGGKRLRPLLALASADAVAPRAGIDRAEARRLALPAACALEMIHTYSLVHDDLPAMDNDTLRRGRPTLHVVHGEGMAILAGDGLQAEAFHVLARDPATWDPAIVARKLQVIRRVAEAAGPAGMVGGQALDLAAAADAPADPAALEAMHRRKTGALIKVSAEAGAIMAGAGQREIEAIGGFAASMGLAFQIIDDILDVEGNAADLGKTAGKDAAAGKPTYPAVYGLTRSRELAEACLRQAADALASVDLIDSPLHEFGRWILDRRS